ncbi:MAG: phosphotransferase, partial [Bacteroidales bacterium]|nr:phosphotransferase [Bacteroidales bacterium]
MEDTLSRLFESYTGKKVTECTEINSSGSNRRYYRIKGGDISLVGVTGTSLEENKAFLAIDKHFVEAGINVPKVLAVSEDSMSYIQEDLGDESLFSAVAHGRETGEYSDHEKALLCKVAEELP